MIFLLTAVNMFNYMDRLALSVLAPSIQLDLQLSDSQLSLLIGFAFALFYSICGMPIARWADRGNRRNIMALALATWSVMTALSGTVRNFWQLCLVRAGVGAGEGGGIAPAYSLLCDYVPLNKRSGAFAIHMGGSAGGILLGMTLAGWLGETIGWRATFLVIGLPGVLLALVLRLTLREPVRGSFDAARQDTSEALWFRAIGILWRCRTYRMLVVFWTTSGFVNYALFLWWPSFFSRLFALDLSSIGIWLGIANGVGGGLGAVIGGLAADKMMVRDIRRPLIVGAVATSMCVPTALAALFASSASMSTVFVFLMSILSAVPSGAVLAAQYSVVSSELRATAGSVAIFFTSALGLGLGTFCVGVLSDYLAPLLGAESLRYALLAPILLIPVAVMALLAAAKSMPDDLR